MLRSNNVAHKYESTRNDMLENFIAILEVAQLFSNEVYTLGTMRRADAQFQSL